MSGLAALLAGHNPPDLYQWHNAAHVEDVQHAVEKAGWAFCHLDSWTVEDQESFLKAAAASCSLPDTADSFDSFAQELDGVSGGDRRGLVLLWDGWSPLARHDEGAFTSALGAFGKRARSDANGKFAVLLRGDGPSIDVPELPDRHT